MMAKRQPETKSTDKKSVKTSATTTEKKTKKSVKAKKDELQNEVDPENDDTIDENEEFDDLSDDEAVSDKSEESEDLSDEQEEEGDELEQDPLVKKLISYASSKQIISWDEITEILTPEFVNSPKMENVLQLLTKNNIQVMEEDELIDEDDSDVDVDDEDGDGEGDISDDDVKDGDIEKHRLVANDKDSGIDDPIRLYLREIGKENLLTAEQEVTLSKQMEDGLNIIKKVINNSGMIIPEFYTICHTIYKKIDPHEPGKARKEINELMAERRRLRSCYVEYVKPIREQMNEYMSLKKHLHTEDPSMNIFNDEELQKLRNIIIACKKFCYNCICKVSYIKADNRTLITNLPFI